MIDGLIGGRLCGEAKWVTGSSGTPYVRARVRAEVSRGGTMTVNVTAFEELVQKELLALRLGATIALTGSITPKLWRDKTGEMRQSLDMTAHAVLTPYDVGRKRNAAALPDDEKVTEAPKPANSGDHGDDAGARAKSSEVAATSPTQVAPTKAEKKR